MTELMGHAISRIKVKKDSVEKTLTEGHYQQDKFIFIFRTEVLLSKLLNRPNLEIGVELVKGPSDILLGKELIYELVLDPKTPNKKSITMFYITYVTQTGVQVSKKPGIQKLQRRISKRALGKFLDRSSSHVRLLSQAEKELEEQKARGIEMALATVEEIEVYKPKEKNEDGEDQESIFSDRPSVSEKEDKEEKETVISETSSGQSVKRRYAELRQKKDALVSPRENSPDSNEGSKSDESQSSTLSTLSPEGSVTSDGSLEKERKSAKSPRKTKSRKESGSSSQSDSPQISSVSVPSLSHGIEEVSTEPGSKEQPRHRSKSESSVKDVKEIIND